MKRLLLFSLLFCIVILLSACDVQNDTTVSQLTEPTTASPTTINMDDIVFHKATVDLVEAPNGMGADYAASKDLELTQYQGTTYAFEPSISLDDRKHCIQTTKAILERISAEKRIQINIYTTESYRYTFVDAGMVHTHVQDWESVDYACAVLYGIFGEHCNYGLIYGYANYLLAEVYGVSLEVHKDGWNYAGNMDALDLSLLCFRSEFADEESITSIRKIANTFVADYIGNYGETAFLGLLGSSGDVGTVDSFVQTLSAYYADKGIDHTPSNILYRLGGKSYDYIVKCPYAVMFIEEDWYDANKDLCPYTYDNFLHENYSDTKQFFTINIRQMEQYQERFALDSYNHDLKIYFTNHSGVHYSHYNGYRHAIALYNTASLMHEYIHALTFGSYILEPWAVEGLARYFDKQYDYYGVAMCNVDYNNAPDTAKFRWIHEFKQNLGRDIDILTDNVEIQHISTYVYSYDNPNDGEGYAPGASFIGYLISRFGEEKVIEIICKTHDFGEYTYEELVADWNAFIAENYSGYTKVK